MTDQYIPGTCNIGPEEIAIRRRAGHAGLAVTAALATALLRSSLHPAWRLTLALPAAGAASGYLQARQRFCANYGFRSLYNFDTRGHEQPVPPPTPRKRTAGGPSRSPQPLPPSGSAWRWPRCLLSRATADTSSCANAAGMGGHRPPGARRHRRPGQAPAGPAAQLRRNPGGEPHQQ